MKLFRYLFDQIWTLAGVALVVITLSGETRSQALLISGAAILLGLAATFIKKDEDND
jgi:hypothetical protein